MKKILINLILSIFFSITLISVVFCLTLLNNKFVIHQFEKNNYYDVILNNLKNEDLTLKYNLNQIKKDVNNYIKNGYKNNYKSNILGDTKKVEIYNNHIKFLNLKYEFYKIKVVGYIITFILVIFTGNVLLKTKKYHDIFLILIMGFVISVLGYGFIYIFNNIENIIVSSVVNTANHYLLAISIILLEIGLFNKIKTRLNK